MFKLLIVTTLVGAVTVFVGGALLSPEDSPVKVTAAIRHGGYFKLIISTDHPSSDPPCSMEVEHWKIGVKKSHPLQNHKTAANIVSGHDIALTCDKKNFSKLLMPNLVCPEPPDIQYGLVTYDGRKAAYTCNPGYIMEGNEVLTCSIRLGKWIPAPPICIEGENNHTFNLTNQSISNQHAHPFNLVNGNIALESEAASPTCNYPGMIANGYEPYVRRGTAVGEKVYYRCKMGFTLKGDSIRTCQKDYTWSGVAPVCTGCWLQIQLFEGRHRCEGLLRVKHFGFWETICSRDFSDTAKQVICHHLGCGDLIPGGTLQVHPPTIYLNAEDYECNGNEKSLCECNITKGYCPPSSTASSTVNIQCKEGPGDTTGYFKDPMIELKGVPDPCVGQVIIRGGVQGSRSEAFMCDKEPTLEMANVMCRQLKCGPPVTNPPFDHVLIYTPPRIALDIANGFKCRGCEPGLGYCNPTQPNCPSINHVLTLRCAKPEHALTKTGACSPVKYTTRRVDHKDESGVEYTCNPIEDIYLCPNFVDVNGRCCKGKATSKNIDYVCVPKSGKGSAMLGSLPVLYHTTCSFE